MAKISKDLTKRRKEQETKGFHKCLLCPCYIKAEEVYCSICGYEVWAVKSNAEDHGGEYAKQWEALQKKIENAKNERN